ncbi:hypothetical protein C8R43DRAFT_1142859 [Mycena crocata]|nr:hypothetical protein C8R43DRAFT_1142859 [Mycena crocata]
MDSGTSQSIEFWFQDGDVILNCPHLGQRFLYRVHKFILSQHSAPFAAMLAREALDSGGLETLDGLPVVTLPEPAAEIHKLLYCLYNALGSFQDEKRPIARYDWLLSICRKYKIVPLQQRIVEQLKAEWPAILREWDMRELRIGILHRQHVAASPSGLVHNLYLDDRLSEPVGIIEIARALGVPQLIPAAFYDLTRRDPHMDWDALHTVETRRRPEIARCLVTGMRSVRWRKLSAVDLLAVAALKQRQLDLIHELCNPECSKLPHPECQAKRVKFLTLVEDSMLQSRDLLNATRAAISQASGVEMCPSCKTCTVERIAAVRTCFWHELVDKFLPAQ